MKSLIDILSIIEDGDIKKEINDLLLLNDKLKIKCNLKNGFCGCESCKIKQSIFNKEMKMLKYFPFKTKYNDEVYTIEDEIYAVIRNVNEMEPVLDYKVEQKDNGVLLLVYFKEKIGRALINGVNNHWYVTKKIIS